MPKNASVAKEYSDTAKSPNKNFPTPFTVNRAANDAIKGTNEELNNSNFNPFTLNNKNEEIINDNA